MDIDVAVIPCAGAGTRMRPATRVIPKAMIPVVDRPVIQYVVEEAASVGVTEVVLVVDDRPGSPVISHFTAGPPIEGLEHVCFTAVVQSAPRGLGDAVLTAADAVGDRPFLCMLADNMFLHPEEAFTGDLVGDYDGRPVLAVREVEGELLSRYGIVDVGGLVSERVVLVRGAVEKPGSGAAPSSLGLVGRYVFPPEVFGVLASLDPGHGGEIQLTDAIDRMARAGGAIGRIVNGALRDIGLPLGLAEATAAVCLSRPDLAVSYREYLERILGYTA